MEPSLNISIEEAVQLGAVDGVFYSRYFFPKVARQPSPQIHYKVWAELNRRDARYIGVKMARDLAKTTILRLFTSQRIAYGISHAILYVSAAESHAARSVRWLKRQIELNTMWVSVFGLSKGGKWTDGEIEIIHGVDEYPIYVLAAGITGSIRGLNFDSWRPDLIIADDIDNEETTTTEEQRSKTSGLFFGALQNGLSPATEAPDAKMAALQTPLAGGDVIDQIFHDPTWTHLECSVFDADGESTWPDRYPTKVLQAEKSAYIARNQLHIWMREKEVKITSPELAAFRLEWLELYEHLPENLTYYIAIDPASSEAKSADDFVIVAVGVGKKRVYLAEVIAEKAIMPDLAVTELVRMILLYKPRFIVVETIAYQKILAWYIKREFNRLRLYWPIREEDHHKRAKGDRILQGFLQLIPHRYKFAYKATQVKFLSQFTSWRPGAKMHDDILDAVSMAFSAIGTMGEDDDNVIEAEVIEETNARELEFRGAP